MHRRSTGGWCSGTSGAGRPWRENARLWQRSYLPSPLYQPYETWDRWLPEYRALIVEVQEIADQIAQ
jgi:hypothetical protein